MRFKLNQRNKGDGIDFLASVKSGSAPLVIFDPQYRAVLDKMAYGNEGARQKGRAALPQMPEAMIASFLTEIERALRPSGHLFLWVDKFMLVERAWGIAIPGLKPVDLLTWRKPRLGMGYRTRRKSEHLLIFQKPPIRAKGIWTVHDIPDALDDRGGGGHAHAKPVEIQRRLICAVTVPGELVIDPSAGGYSVLTATQSCGRNFLGCDLLG